jgi:hypothetical protein
MYVDMVTLMFKDKNFQGCFFFLLNVESKT